MTRIIKPPYQLIEFSGGGLNLGGYAQIAGYLPPVTLLTSIGGLQLGGQGLALPPVSDRGGLRLGGRARSPILVGQYSPNLARFGSTTGMTVVVNSPNSQGSQYLPDIGFPFPLYGATYRNNIAISSNWALLFGFNALASTDISHTVPGQAFLMAASLARSWDRVLVKADNSYSYRIRFETQIAFGTSPIYNVFEVTLYSDGSIQLVCGTNFDFYGFSGALRVRSLTKGDNVSYADFDRPYPYTPDTASASAGVDSSYVFAPDDNAANSHTVRLGSYLPLAYYPPISNGGLRLGGRSNLNILTGYTYSSAIAALQDNTGMTQVVSSFGDDVGQYLPDIGFNFPIYGSTYRSNISIGSNWYLLFGSVNTAFSGLSRTVPGMGLLFGAADRSWQNVYFKADTGFCRIRFEGHVTSSGTSYTAIFQIKLFVDGTIELTIGIGAFYNPLGITPIQTLTKGDGITYADFTVPAGSTAQGDFTSTAVLTSLVFKPVDVIGSSHTIQIGSYLSSASAGLSGAIVQPQLLAVSLSVGAVPAGLNGSINQPQSLAGGLAAISSSASVAPVISLLLLSSGGLTVSSGAISQPQILAGSLIVGASLSASISQPQSLIGGLSIAIPLASSISQSQSLSGSLSNAPPGLSSAIVQPQTLTGSLIVAAPLVSNISQIQTLTGGLSVAKSLVSNISQSQTLTGGLSVRKLLTSSVSQPQVLAGGLIVRASLSASISQPQSLTGGLSVAAPLTSNISQSQSLSGLLSSLPSGLSSAIVQPQTLTSGLSVAPPPQAETTSWISRVQGLGGQPTTAATTAVDAFFVAIKSSTYFSKLKLLHLFAGTSTIASSMAPLLHPTNTAASLSGFSSSDYTASGSGAGIQGNGTGYIDHSYSPFGSSPGFDSAFGTYSKSSVATGGYDVGYVVNSTARILISTRYDNSSSFADSFDQYYGRINAAPPAGVVFALASRVNASDFRYYYNGAQVGIDTVAVATMPSTVSKFYSFYGGLVSGFPPSPLKLTFSFASTGLTPTEVAAFSTAVSNLIGAI